MAVYLAVAGDLFDSVYFRAVLFPMRCLGWDVELNLSSFYEFSYLLLIVH